MAPDNGLDVAHARLAALRGCAQLQLVLSAGPLDDTVAPGRSHDPQYFSRRGVFGGKPAGKADKRMGQMVGRKGADDT